MVLCNVCKAQRQQKQHNLFFSSLGNELDGETLFCVFQCPCHHPLSLSPYLSTDLPLCLPISTYLLPISLATFYIFIYSVSIGCAHASKAPKRRRRRHLLTKTANQIAHFNSFAAAIKSLFFATARTDVHRVTLSSVVFSVTTMYQAESQNNYYYTL